LEGVGMVRTCDRSFIPTFGSRMKCYEYYEIELSLKLSIYLNLSVFENTRNTKNPHESIYVHLMNQYNNMMARTCRRDSSPIFLKKDC
jgi:hypothetical protein